MRQISDDAFTQLDSGIRMLKSFTCDHQKVIRGNTQDGLMVTGQSCRDIDRGALCNGCWAKGWAEEMDRELSRRTAAPTK